MLETRRMFVLAMAGAAGFLAAEESRLVGQYPPTPPPPPQPAETPNPAEMPSNPRAAAPAGAAGMQQNVKEFGDGVERLYQISVRFLGEVRQATRHERL